MTIHNSYGQYTVSAGGENFPATYNADYNPPNGFYSTIRILNLAQPDWNNSWDFGVNIQDNSLLGIAALQNFAVTQDAKLLAFAESRANFLASMQDTDGGIRYGPQGQFYPSGDSSFFWNLKVVSSNEIALYFFDNLYKVTGNLQYKNTADKIYSWLAGMFSSTIGTFSHSSTFVNGQWSGPDTGETSFTPDTTAWAPIDRMLTDSTFGATVADRMARIDTMISNTEIMTGDRDGRGNIAGFTFNIDASLQGVISMDLSSIMALLYFKMAQINQTQGNDGQAAVYTAKYNNMMYSLKKYVSTVNSLLAVPAAVRFDGSTFEGILINPPNTFTPYGYSSESASMSYLFALQHKNPLIVDPAMIAHLKKRHKKGGIDFTAGRMNLHVKAFSSVGKSRMITFNLDPSMILQLQNARGFEPVIVRMQPIHELSDFLGIQSENWDARVRITLPRA